MNIITLIHMYMLAFGIACRNGSMCIEAVAYHAFSIIDIVYVCAWM